MANVQSRQLVDWSSALWASLVAGTLFLLIAGWIVPLIVGGNIWVILRLMASLVMGKEILAPPATFHPTALIIGLLVHYSLSMIFTCALAWIIHRWGLITGIILGGLFGWGLYLINIYSLTLFFPWFIVMKHNAFLFCHIIFGIAAGGMYEALEVEQFIKRKKH